MTVLVIALATGFGWAADVPISALVAGTPLQRMTLDAYNKAGLQKLSPEELQYLGRWIAAYTQNTTAPAAAGGVIKTRIDGDFNGWEGDTVYKMRNGQIWQQSGYHYHYHYAYSPEVMIYSADGGYKIHVEGDSDEDVAVRRLN